MSLFRRHQSLKRSKPSKKFRKQTGLGYKNGETGILSQTPKTLPITDMAAKADCSRKPKTSIASGFWDVFPKKLSKTDINNHACDCQSKLPKFDDFQVSPRRLNESNNFLRSNSANKTSDVLSSSAHSLDNSFGKISTDSAEILSPKPPIAFSHHRK